MPTFAENQGYMANNYLNRYAWLIDVIRRHEYITLTDISDLWERSALNDTGGPLPERTFHNHRKSIEEIFGIEIKFNKARGYYLAGSDELSSEMNDWLLTSLSVSAAVNESKDLKDRILFAEMPSGKRFLTSIINAMKENKMIEVVHQAFGVPQAKGYLLSPYCVKAFKQRWYVLAKDDDTGKVKFINIFRKNDCDVHMVDAQNNPDKLYFVVLDEMSLAQVEYYFAKILSAMEIEDDNENKKTIDLFSQKDHENSRDKILFKIENLFKKYMDEDKKKRISDASKLSELDKLKFIREILAEEPYNDQEIDIYFKLLEEWNNLNNYPSQIKISENVQFVGTINMDASTKNISPKVVDRSFLIELREEEKISDDVEEYEAVTPRMVTIDDIGRIVNNNSEFIGANRDVVISMVNEFIKDFNEISGLNLRLSMRGYKRIETMLEGMGKLNSDIDEINEAKNNRLKSLDCPPH